MKMKNSILMTVLLFSFQLHSQEIKLPKLPKLSEISNPFKKNIRNSFKVKWSCHQEEYTEVAQLVSEADVEVYINKKGEVSYRPNVFKVKPLSKEFVQGLNPRNLINKKKTFKVDYTDCVSEFYNKVQKAHQDLKQTCKGDSSPICTLNDKEFIGKARHTVEKSRYLAPDENTVLLPKLLPGTNSMALSSEAILSGLKDFCETGSIKSKQELLSGSVLREITKNSNKYPAAFPGLDCIGKYGNLWKNETDKLQKEYCSDNVSNPICATVRDRLLKSETELTGATAKMKKNVERQQKNFTQYGELEDGKVVDEHLKTAFKLPEGECKHSNSESINGKSVDVSHFDQEISDNLEKIFSQGSAECQRRFLQNYISAKIQSGIDDKEFSEYCKLHQTEYCKKVQGSPELVLKNIERMMALVHGDLGQGVYNEEIACHVDEKNTIGDILDKLKDNEKAIRCAELKDGEFKNIHWKQNPITNSGEYTLKKVGDNKYEAYLNIAFSSNEGVSTTPQEMNDRAKDCLAAVSPYLKGPQGEELAIKILGENEVNALPINQRPGKRHIGIAKAGFRSEALKYERNVDCPVITHEILHLLGLSDEYKEKWNKDGNNYDCRVVPDGLSIMKNQNDMFDVAVDKNFACDCNSSVCKSIMNSNNPEKVQFYLGKSFYEMTDYVDRSKYCQSSSRLEPVNFDKIINKDLNVVITENFSSKIVIETREFDADPNRVSRSKLICSCEPSDDECIKFLSKTRDTVENSKGEIRGSCPLSTATKEKNIGRNGTDPYSFDESSNILILNKVAKVPSLLHPAHFDRIIGGTCEDKGKAYIECSQFAYRNDNCMVPDYCKDESKFLGTKQ